MTSVRHVLVPIDLSDGSRAALASASVLARAFSARLTALYVSPRGVHDQGALEDELRSFVASFVAPAAGEPVPVVVEARAGDAADEILACGRERGADLIVLGMHSRRPVGRWFLGSVTEDVARRADCAVLAVPWGLDTPSLLRVVCAVDLSVSSAETLAHAAAAAHALRARLIVLHAVDGPHGFEPWTLSGMTEAEARRALCERERARLTELVAPYVRRGLSVELRVEEGDPRPIIERSLHGGVDMAVLGVRPSGRLDRFFYGSTVAHVLTAGVCPVLLVGHRQAVPDSTEEASVSAPEHVV